MGVPTGLLAGLLKGLLARLRDQEVGAFLERARAELNL